MNEIMWKGKSYSGMTVDNGIIINDGDEVVNGSEATSNIQKCGGYRQFLGSQGCRLICQGNLTLMGKMPQEERIDLIEDGWQYKSTSMEEWADSSFTENNIRHIVDINYINNIKFRNKYDQDKNIIGMEADPQPEIYSQTYGWYARYTGLSVDFTNEEGYLINFIQPGDLYNKVYMKNASWSGWEAVGGVDFTRRINGIEEFYIKTKIVSANLDNYEVRLFWKEDRDETQYMNGTYLIPKESNMLGLFLYCTEWSQDYLKIGLGIASFNVTDSTHYRLTSFFPIGNFYYNKYGNVFNVNVTISNSVKVQTWQTYYRIAKNSNNKAYFNTNDGQFYADYDEETSTFSNQIPGQAGGTVFLDLLTNNYYMCSSYVWYLLYVTSADDSYVYSPVNNVDGGRWTAISPSPEYEYAAQITQTYNYIDRATYNSLVPSDSDD